MNYYEKITTLAVTPHIYCQMGADDFTNASKVVTYYRNEQNFTGPGTYSAVGGWTEPSTTIKKHGTGSSYYHEGARESWRFNFGAVKSVHLEFWIYIPVVNNATVQQLFTWDTLTTNTSTRANTKWSAVQLNPTRTITWRTRYADFGNEVGSNLTTTAVIPLATWTHIAVQFSGFSTDKKIYINGVLSASGAGSSVGGGINYEHNLQHVFHLPDAPLHQRFYVANVALWSYIGANNALPTAAQILERVNFKMPHTRYWNTQMVTASPYEHRGFKFAKAGDEKYWDGTQWVSFIEKTVQSWNGSAWVTVPNLTGQN